MPSLMPQLSASAFTTLQDFVNSGTALDRLRYRWSLGADGYVLDEPYPEAVGGRRRVTEQATPGAAVTEMLLAGATNSSRPTVMHFGAFADGTEHGVAEHPLWTAISADPAAWGYTIDDSGPKWSLIETTGGAGAGTARDTADWLALDLQQRYLEKLGAGGDAILPAGAHLVTKRHLYLRNNIRLLGHGQTTILNNISTLSGGYNDTRSRGFLVGDVRVETIAPTSGIAAAQADIAADLGLLDHTITLASGAVASLDIQPGDFIFLVTGDGAITGTGDAEQYVPRIGRIRRVVNCNAAADTITVDRPVDGVFTVANSDRIHKFGTGTATSLNGVPHFVCEGARLENLTVNAARGTGRTALYEGHMSDIWIPANALGNPFPLNACCFMTIERLHIDTLLRGPEVKIGTEALDFREMHVRSLAESPTNLALLNTGEQSDKVSVYDSVFEEVGAGGSGTQARLVLRSRRNHLENVDVICRSTGAHKVLEAWGEAALGSDDVNVTGTDIRLTMETPQAVLLNFRAGGGGSSSNACTIAGLTLTGTSTSGTPLNFVKIKPGSTITGFFSSAGYTKGGAEAANVTITA